MNFKNYPDTITANQLAEILGVTRRTIYNNFRQRKGFPKPFRVGRKLLWDKGEIEAYVQSKRVAS